MQRSFRLVSAIFSYMIFAVLLLVMMPPPPAQAVGWTPYTRASFLEAQAAGKTVIVGVHADW